jgi:hypothetical protein
MRPFTGKHFPTTAGFLVQPKAGSIGVCSAQANGLRQQPMRLASSVMTLVAIGVRVDASIRQVGRWIAVIQWANLRLDWKLVESRSRRVPSEIEIPRAVRWVSTLRPLASHILHRLQALSVGRGLGWWNMSVRRGTPRSVSGATLGIGYRVCNVDSRLLNTCARKGARFVEDNVGYLSVV